MSFHQLTSRLFLAFFTLTLAACGGDSSSSSSNSPDPIDTVDLNNFAEASVVIGQPDFQSGQANQGNGDTNPNADTLDGPYGGPAYVNDILYLGDFSNNRVLGYEGIPEVDGAAADIALGQSDFTSTTVGSGAGSMNRPYSPASNGDQLFVPEYSNNRVLIFDPVPEGPRDADRVLGQTAFGDGGGSCAADGLNSPADVSAPGERVIVADDRNNRVLIWNSAPQENGAEPDLVLGQQSLDKCAPNDTNNDGSSDDPSASTLDSPAGVWSDGEKLIIADRSNNRVLIWNTFPETNFASADVVLGQQDFTLNADNDKSGDGEWEEEPAADTLFGPESVDSNGKQVVVADGSNNRVLAWQSFPQSNGAAADYVLGQGDFSHNTANDADQDKTEDTSPSAKTFNYPAGVTIIDGQTLIVTDVGNNRYLIFEE